MANQREKAKQILDYALERATDEDYEELKARMEKYFN